MQETSATPEYISGTCNLGFAEIRRRYRIGFFGLALMVIFIIYAEVFDIPHIWKLFLFAPTFYALSGFLQARQRFCYIYGWKGVFSIIGQRKLSRVKEDHDLQKDRRMAIRLVLRILIGSIILTLMYYFLSHQLFRN